MHWVCVLVRFVSKNMRKTLEKRNWLAFLPNVQCNIEKNSRVFLTLANFLAFLLRYQHVGIKNVRKNARKNKKTRGKINNAECNKASRI